MTERANEDRIVRHRSHLDPVRGDPGHAEAAVELGIAHYEPPPDVIDNLDKLREEDAFREANELRA